MLGAASSKHTNPLPGDPAMVVYDEILATAPHTRAATHRSVAGSTHMHEFPPEPVRARLAVLRRSWHRTVT